MSVTRIKTPTGWEDLTRVGGAGPVGPVGPAGPAGPAGTLTRFNQTINVTTDSSGKATPAAIAASTGQQIISALRLQANANFRVRFYARDSDRTTDLSRPSTQDPIISGVLLEVIFTSTVRDVIMGPAVDLWSFDDPTKPLIYTVDNAPPIKYYGPYLDGDWSELMSVFGPTLALCFFNNDAEFRSWAQVLHNAIAACGQVQTTDTGQINLTTVAKPASAGVIAGYEIWRFDDALQATAPVFWKIEYGTGGSAATQPAIWITVGSQTNGAGTLAGAMTTRQALAPTTSTSGITKNVYASGANNRIWLAGGIDWATTGHTYFFFIERTKNAAGADTADGIMVQTAWYTSTWFQSGLWQGGIPVGAQGGPLFWPPPGSRMTLGTDLSLLPSLYFQGKPFYSTMLGSDVSAVPGSLVYTVNYLGGNHTYLSLGGALYTYFMSSAGNAGYYPQVLWE